MIGTAVAATVMMSACNSREVAALRTDVLELQLQQKMAQLDSTRNGRFVIVNGTPELARNIMLLDTQTGRTWIACTAKDVGSTDSNWCSMGFAGRADAP
ncbi:hypothetical protein [Gemmatimonas sp.]|uniref:hypothetical protein n=1 Tax=Gemmatimonas sp. TaxID=1962908 RepID=UPI00286DC4B3|nr:hypothetical protein [Gemmatimonas sp.]